MSGMSGYEVLIIAGEPSNLLLRSDTLLYEAKRSGRNRTPITTGERLTEVWAYRSLLER